MKFSFEDQLTFAPKLNSLSMKMAELNRTPITERKKQEKPTLKSPDLIFKPIVSNNSTKIAARLKTGFWDRHNIHVQHQKEMVR